MKARNLFFVSVLSVLICACGSNNEKNKNGTQPLTKDSTISEEKMPSLEKEFADTLQAKPSKDSVLLKFNFQKGKTYNYAMNFDVTQKRGDESRESIMKWSYDMVVTDETSHLTTMKATYKKIEMTMNMGNGQKMEFSSEKPVETADFMQLPSKMFKIMTGKSFMLQINDKGDVVSVLGFDKIGQDVASQIDVPEQMKPMMRQNFQRQFNNDAVKQAFAQAFEIYPNKYVKVGDTWKTDTNLMPVKQEVATVYKVRNIKGNRVFVTGEAKLKSDDGNDAGTQTSKLILDANSGLMIDGVFDQKSSDGQTISRSRITGKEL